MSFNEAPCKCCLCTSLCRTGIPIIRFSDGSYSPPSVTRRIPDSDRTEVVWLHPQLNTAWGDLSCAWNLVSGSVFEQTWDSVPKGAGYLAALAALGIDPAELAGMHARAAVDRITQTQNENLPLLWNNILQITDSNVGFPGDPLRGPFTQTTGEFEPSLLSTWEVGTLLTRSLKGCQAHEVTLSLPPLSREITNEGRTDYEADPWTVDTLIGCDAFGENPMATLRLRVEHGVELTPADGGYTSDEALESHVLLRHKDYSPLLSSTKRMVELLSYAELLNEDGDVEQSFLIPAGLQGADGVEWRIFFADGSINAMMVGGLSVHVFDSYTPSRDAQAAEFIGVSFVEGNARQMSVIHNPLTQARRERVIERPTGPSGNTQNITLELSPSTPADLVPYCDPTNPQYQRDIIPGGLRLDSYPWRLNSRCEWWVKEGRISAQKAGGNFSELQLVIDYDEYFVGGFQSSLKSWPHGTFSLGAVSGDDQDILDNVFWFGEDINEDFSGAVILGGDATVTGTIKRVEWSVDLRWFGDSGVSVTGNRSRCGDQWAQIELRGRFTRTISSDPGVTQSFFYYVPIPVGEQFFRGEKVDAPKDMRWTVAPLGFTESFPIIPPPITLRVDELSLQLV